jgi:hypothetical protein
VLVHDSGFACDGLTEERHRPIELQLAPETGILVGIVEQLAFLLLGRPDHAVSVDTHALGEFQKLPHAHLLYIAGIGDVLGHVGKLGETAPKVVAGQDIDLGRLGAIPIPADGAPLSPPVEH